MNASKTKTMIVSRSLTMHPPSAAVTIGGTVLKESDNRIILGVTFDFKMTLRSIVAPFPKELLKGLVS